MYSCVLACMTWFLGCPDAGRAETMLHVQSVYRSLDPAAAAFSDKDVTMIWSTLDAALGGVSDRKVFKGDGRLILDFYCSPSNRKRVERSLRGVCKLPLDTKVKLEAWKQTEENPPAAGRSGASSEVRPKVVELPAGAGGMQDIVLKVDGSLIHELRASGVTLGELLELLGRRAHLLYVCDEPTARRRVSVHVREITVGDLLTVLKGCLDLSVTRVMKVYVVRALNGTGGGAAR